MKSIGVNLNQNLGFNDIMQNGRVYERCSAGGYVLKGYARDIEEMNPRLVEKRALGTKQFFKELVGGKANPKNPFVTTLVNFVKKAK